MAKAADGDEAIASAAGGAGCYFPYTPRTVTASCALTPVRPAVSYPFERSVYRIQYPERVRPSLILRDGTVPVIDCSEDGLRYLPAGGALPEIGTAVEGRVRFQSGHAEVAVKGTVIRCQAGEVAVHLAAPGLPRAVLFAEQRFLGSRYPQRLPD